MSYYLKLGGVLLLIAAIASGVLAFVNGFTRPIIDENRRRAEEEARQEVLPAAEEFTLVENDFSYYIGYDSGGEIAGYTFLASETGYSGIIQTMVGVDRELKIRNIKILEQTETPGLGANAARPEFTGQFRDRRPEELILDKEGGEIVTITGATITTRAITNSLQKAIRSLSEDLLSSSGRASNIITE